jgi:hypothetical protein
MPAPYGQPDPKYHERLLLGLIPEHVQKSADVGEINRRLAEARKLSAQASDMGLDPLLRMESKQRAQAVLCAPVPVRKASPVAPARAPSTRKAPPRRPVAKAGGKNDPVPVFDADGNLIGVADPDDIQPVGTAQQDAAEDIAKATRQALAYSQQGRPLLIRKGSAARPGESMATARARRDRWIAKDRGR